MSSSDLRKVKKPPSQWGALDTPKRKECFYLVLILVLLMASSALELSLPAGRVREVLLETLSATSTLAVFCLVGLLFRHQELKR